MHFCPVLGQSDLPVLTNLLAEAAGKWDPIGVQLKFSPGNLDIIKRDCLNIQRECLSRMLTKWLDQVDPRPTVGILVKALSSSSVDEKVLAQCVFGEFAVAAGQLMMVLITTVWTIL